MATINNQATLRTAVAEWLNRTDLTTNQLDQFIEMGEAMIYEELRVPTLEASERTTVVATKSKIDIPNGLLEIIDLKLIDSDGTISLNRVGPKAFYNNDIPHSFIRDKNEYLIKDKEGKDTAAGLYELKFYQSDYPIGTVVGGVEQIPYVLEEYELSLYSALALGSSFLGDSESEARYIQLVVDKITKLNSKAARSELKGGLYTSGFSSRLI